MSRLKEEPTEFLDIISEPSFIEDIRVDSNIPIPAWGALSDKNPKLIKFFNTLKDGDSFIAPKRKRSTLASYAKYFNFKIIERRITHDKCRFWVVKE